MKPIEPSSTASILIIDDQPNNLAILVEYLENLGFEILVSQNGKSGLARANHVQPALIILDVLMPDIDGYEVCRQLKAEQQTRDIPVIFLTALTTTDEIVKGFEVGGVDYISKPVQLEEARVRIETHLTICKLQEELRQREAHCRTIVESVSDSLFVLNEAGQIIDTNPAALLTYGYSKEELLGSTLTQLISPEYREIFELCQQELLETGNYSAETVDLRKDGSLINAEIRGTTVQCEGEKYWVATARDVTKRKKLEQEMLKIKKLEAMATLSGGIAHDFINLLSIVLGHIDLVRSTLPIDSRDANNLDQAKEAAIQAANLAKRLITFSSGGKLVKKTCSIKQLLTDSVALAFSDSVLHCELALPDDLWPVDVDAGQISQVFSFIFNNSKEALPNDSRVWIRAENHETEAEHNQVSEPQQEVGQIKITIQDHGCGIAPQYLSRVFDPYFSTKEMGNVKGQGLGLTIAHAIIRKHGGSIELESQLDFGTKVLIYLPVAIQEN